MNRPDPDLLLAHVAAEEARARRGRLRIFFGASAGGGARFEFTLPAPEPVAQSETLS